jgi:hypothetical protein
LDRKVEQDRDREILFQQPLFQQLEASHRVVDLETDLAHDQDDEESLNVCAIQVRGSTSFERGDNSLLSLMMLHITEYTFLTSISGSSSLTASSVLK